MKYLILSKHKIRYFSDLRGEGGVSRFGTVILSFRVHLIEGSRRYQIVFRLKLSHFEIWT